MEYLAIIALTGALNVSNYDGDTVTVNGEHYRIVGMDTPEIPGKCPREKALAKQAKSAMTMFLHSQGAELRQVWCAGAHLTDKYGRLCGKVFVNGQDVSPLMVENGLAHPYKCIGRCPRRLSWC